MDKSFQVYLVRHGQTAWTLSGQHTGRTDIPLTEQGRELAGVLKKALSDVPFTAVYSSPLKRALETCHIAGFESPLQDELLVEWNYGDYEGIRTAEIHQTAPGWNLFKDGAPHGESCADVGARADLMIAKICQEKGPVILFSHGHFLRVFVARWLKLPPEMGTLFTLATESISILGFEHNTEEPVLKLLNSQRHIRT